MEHLAEQLVATYLTRGGRVFIVPQYPVPSDTPGQDWSCPDFVALNFERPDRPEVVVVEVASGSNINGVLQKIADRKTQWYDRLRLKLSGDGIIDDRWTLRFLGFVREDNLKKAERKFVGAADVTFQSLESVTFPWKYWGDRFDGGLRRQAEVRQTKP